MARGGTLASLDAFQPRGPERYVVTDHAQDYAPDYPGDVPLLAFTARCPLRGSGCHQPFAVGGGVHPQ